MCACVRCAHIFVQHFNDAGNVVATKQLVPAVCAIKVPKHVRGIDVHQRCACGFGVNTTMTIKHLMLPNACACGVPSFFVWCTHCARSPAAFCKNKSTRLAGTRTTCGAHPRGVLCNFTKHTYSAGVRKKIRTPRPILQAQPSNFGKLTP